MNVTNQRARKKTHQSSGGSTEDLAQEYFSSVKQSRIQLLYQLYHLDFEMFDYSPEYFINIGISDLRK